VIRRMYDWTLALAARPNAMTMLAVIAFIESSVFPIPPDVMLLPMVLAAREKAWRIAGVATLASVAGGLAGYAIGYYGFEGIGRPLLEFYGYGENVAEFREQYGQWGAWIVFGAGLTPFPFKVITVASGALALDPVVFVIASIAARGLRFYAEAALLWKFGPPIKDFVEKRLELVATLAFILLIGGFAAVSLLG
jgi:membrane protein YqaA with SNARE-associated domain